MHCPVWRDERIWLSGADRRLTAYAPLQGALAQVEYPTTRSSVRYRAY